LNVLVIKAGVVLAQFRKSVAAQAISIGPSHYSEQSGDGVR
jgi:hypothetical protein